MEDYRKTFNQMIEELRQRFGNNLNDDLIKMFQMEKQAIDRLVNQTLVLQECEELNLQITDTELAESIKSIGAFQTGGIFDGRLYKNILNRNRLTPEMFETDHKQSLLINKLQSFILSNVKVSEQEAEEWYKWNNASVNIEYVLFSPDTYKDINPKDEEVQTFFKDHGSNYKTEPKVKVRFLRFNTDNYKKEVKILPEDILDYYEANLAEFEKPKTVSARHILIKVDEKATDATVEETRKRATDIYKMAAEGKDFAELAQKHSEGPTKDKGGDLGEFKKESMVKPFSDKAFSMKAGEVSEPVRTRFGWHVIKVEKVNEASKQSVEEATPNVTTILTEKNAKNLAYDHAESVADLTNSGDDLVYNAKSNSMTLKTTVFFTRTGPGNIVKNPDKFAAAAFELAENELSEVKDLDDGYYIIEMLEKIPAKIDDLQNVKQKVKKDLINKIQREKAEKDAGEFHTAVKNGVSLDDQSKKLKLTLETTDFFKRTDSIPKIGAENKIIEAAFSLSSENRLAPEVLQGAKGYYIIQFKEKKEPVAAEFVSEKEKTIESLLQKKKNMTFEAWLANVKNNSQITIDQELN